MKIALTQDCLKVKCYFCFSIVADNVILATDTTKTKFWRKFLVPLFSKRGGTVAVLHNTAEKGEWKAADRAHPEPYFGKEEVSARAVDNAIDPIFWHRLCSVDISVAEQGNLIALNIYNAVNDKSTARIGKDHGVLFEISSGDWS